MSRLGEAEIFNCMTENLRLAAEHCENLAILPAKGPTYHALRTSLALVEGCCRQASAWREDTRWLPIGLAMAEAHKRCGDWLRHRNPPKYFLMMAANLRNLYVVADGIKNKATGTTGMILPAALPGPHRDTRPVSVRLPSGLIVPSSVAA